MHTAAEGVHERGFDRMMVVRLPGGGTLTGFLGEAIMRRVVGIMAFAGVLIHILGGCCLHHAHADSLPSDPPQASHSCPCSGHHKHAPESSEDEHSRPDSHECDRHGCIFVVRQPGTSVQRCMTWHQHLPVVVGCLDPAQVSQADARWLIAPAILPNPPVRLHLLNRILLL